MASTLRVIRALSVWWLWFYVAAIALFVISLVPFYQFTTVPAAEQVLYYRTLDKLRIATIVPAFIFFVLGCVLFSLKRRNLQHGIVLFIPTLMGKLVILALIGPATNLPVHLDHETINGHIYNLDVDYIPDPTYIMSDITQFGHPFATRGIYLLYECDSANILCKTIYHEELPLPADMRRYKVELRTSEAGQVSISMGGNVTYTYMPS